MKEGDPEQGFENGTTMAGLGFECQCENVKSKAGLG